MTDSTKPSAASGSDDPWEQLAEDLFGLEFGKEHAPHEPQTPEVAAPAPVASPVRGTSPVVTEWAEEPEIPREVASPPVLPEETQQAASTYAEIPMRPATPSAQDSYWDALANWNWGEGEGSGARGKPPEARRGDAPRSPAPRSRDEGRSAPPADRPAAPAESRTEARRSAPAEATESGDFGSGLAPSTPERAPSRPAAPPRDRVPQKVEAVESDDFDDDEDDEDDESTTTESGEPEASVPGDENAPRKRRRRRRRRRSRNGSDVPGATAPASEGRAGEAPAKVPGEDWDRPSEPPAPAPRSDDRARRPAVEGRPAGEGRPTGEGRPQSERGDDRSRGSRRRRGDRRGPPASVAPERNALPDDDFEGESRADEVMNVGGGDVASDDEGDAGDSLVNFADVPTWEEAISYLLHPNQVQVDTSGGSDSSGDSRSGEQPRQTRHYGGRRP